MPSRPSNAVREIMSEQTIAYLDAAGNTLLLVERATGRVMFRQDRPAPFAQPALSAHGEFLKRWHGGQTGQGR